MAGINGMAERAPPVCMLACSKTDSQTKATTLDCTYATLLDDSAK
jgi:hypothetical protein